jgi:putative ABC transport system substrate-binding protein
MIDRRSVLLSGLTVSLLAPRVAAQLSRRFAHVGILNYAAAQDIRVREFRDGLRELGYVEGQNLAFTYRWADGRLDRLPDLAAELVAAKVDVIIAIGPAVWAAKRATTTIPIVIAFSGDPVGNGIVANLGRPGGNITGFSYMSTDLAAKRLELLTQMLAPQPRVGILYNPDEPATELEMQQTKAAAPAILAKLHPLATRQPNDLPPAFAEAVRERVDALIVFTHGFAVLNGPRIIELAARSRMPTMYGWRDFVDDGGLISYGPNIELMVKKAASYVDRIVKSEKPGDLPVQQATKVELIINMKTAKTLGLTFPDRRAGPRRRGY